MLARLRQGVRSCQNHIVADRALQPLVPGSRGPNTTLAGPQGGPALRLQRQLLLRQRPDRRDALDGRREAGTEFGAAGCRSCAPGADPQRRVGCLQARQDGIYRTRTNQARQLRDLGASGRRGKQDFREGQRNGELVDYRVATDQPAREETLCLKTRKTELVQRLGADHNNETKP
jgi:hypothetical protein